MSHNNDNSNNNIIKDDEDDFSIGSDQKDEGDDDIFMRHDDDDEDDDDDDEDDDNDHPPKAKSRMVVVPNVLPLLDDIPKTTTRRQQHDRHHDPLVVTRVVVMSDTHGQHRAITVLPRGNVLIHAGDLTLRGEPGTLTDVAAYFQELQVSHAFQQVIVVAGNHDVTLQPSFYERQVRAKKRPPLHYTEAVQTLKQSCTYLEDESCHLWTGNPQRAAADQSNPPELLVYGSPWSVEFGTWAFTKPLEQMLPLWQAIPTKTDILITHGPPYRRGDQVINQSQKSNDDDDDASHVGCPALLQQVQERIQPRLHVFGHIHEDRGWVGFDARTMFCNASNVDLRYRPVQPCIVFDIPHDVRQSVQWVQPVSPVATFDQFISWLDDKKQDTYTKLVSHLRAWQNDNDDMDDDLMDWTQPWTALSSLPNVFCALGIHRDKAMQKDFTTALGQVFAESFE